MKYFTAEWWASGGDNAQMVFQQYENHLASIRPQLPPELVVLEAEHTLHDSEVKSIVSDFNDRTVTMILNGWNRKLEYPVRYTLHFSGVSLFDQQLPKQDYVEEELGDLGYWECELIGSAIEIRMLFVSSAEFRIVFTGFDFEHERLKVKTKRTVS